MSEKLAGGPRVRPNAGLERWRASRTTRKSESFGQGDPWIDLPGPSRACRPLRSESPRCAGKANRLFFFSVNPQVFAAICGRVKEPSTGEGRSSGLLELAHASVVVWRRARAREMEIGSIAIRARWRSAVGPCPSARSLRGRVFVLCVCVLSRFPLVAIVPIRRVSCAAHAPPSRRSGAAWAPAPPQSCSGACSAPYRGAVPPGRSPERESSGLCSWIRRSRRGSRSASVLRPRASANEPTQAPSRAELAELGVGFDARASGAPVPMRELFIDLQRAQSERPMRSQALAPLARRPGATSSRRAPRGRRLRATPAPLRRRSGAVFHTHTHTKHKTKLSALKRHMGASRSGTISK